MRITTALLLCALSFGCATRNVAPEFKLTDTARSGVVVGSITYEGAFSGYSVVYRRVGTEERLGRIQTGAGVMLIPYVPRGDRDVLGMRGELFAIELPEGEYEVFRWFIRSGGSSVASTSPFSVRFNVLPGRVIYIGNFHFRQTARLGLTVTGGELNYLERVDRDLPLIKRKFPNLEATQIDLAVERGAEYPSVGGPHKATLDPPIVFPLRIK